VVVTVLLQRGGRVPKPTAWGGPSLSLFYRLERGQVVPALGLQRPVDSAPGRPSLVTSRLGG
jgi:hypothetical protein